MKPAGAPLVFTFELIFGDVEGIRTAFVVPTIPDDAPPAIRETLARRRLATVSG